MLSNKTKKNNNGFTLIETLVGIAVFLVISLAIYQAYANLLILINQDQYRILALSLADEQFEIIRNSPNIQSHPSQDFTRGGISFSVVTTAIDTTIVNENGKLVEVEIDCSSCKDFTPVKLTTLIFPKSL